MVTVRCHEFIALQGTVPTRGRVYVVSHENRYRRERPFALGTRKHAIVSDVHCADRCASRDSRVQVICHASKEPSHEPLVQRLLMNAASLLYPADRTSAYCVECKGTGQVACPECEGTGTLQRKKSDTIWSRIQTQAKGTVPFFGTREWMQTNRCSKCHGSGRVTCKVCKGTGRRA